jgi:nucleoside-diphosphate-sugar epimerase
MTGGITKTPSSGNILILGGTGFVSGTLAQRAIARGLDVWCITRGSKPLPEGAHSIVADRTNNASMRRAIETANRQWDLVVDCIAYQPEDARQDLELFRDRATHLVFISTDFVYSPNGRRLPVGEEGTSYQTEGYGGKKRECEMVLTGTDSSPLLWTILRPTHIYGPGSLIGCLPLHSRDAELLNTIAGGTPLTLVGGGHFLQHPLFATDLAELCLDLAGNPPVHGQTYNVAGPEIVESREYYQIIGELLEREPVILGSPVAEYLRTNPEHAPLVCHRVYDLRKLQASGLTLPSTTLLQGLTKHVENLLRAQGSTRA